MIPLLRKAVQTGLFDLDRIKRRAADRIEGAVVTKRSKAPLIMRLKLTYPGLQPKVIAKLLGVTPQGARKLLDRASGPVSI